MLKENIIELFESLKQCGNLKGTKFSYAIARNINALKEEYKSFQENRIALAESFCKKDENDKCIMKDNIYDIDDTVEFTKKLDELRKEEVEVKTYKIQSTDIPEDISVQQMAGIFELIEESKPLPGKPR